MKNKEYLLVVLFLILFNSCDPCYGGRDVCTDLFQFKIIDKNSQLDLILGSNPVYKVDSIKIRTLVNAGYSEKYVQYDNHNLISSFNFPTDTIYIKLTDVDIDTIEISYAYIKNKCCYSANRYGRIQEVKYNGRIGSKENFAYILSK